MKLWEVQQILCRFQPDAVVHIKLPEGRTVAVDHIEDHYPRADDECTCLDTEDEDGNEVMDPRVWQDPHFNPIDSECGKHGDESYRMPLFVTGDSHSPEVFYQADEAACAHRVLDEMGTPRADEDDKVYSLVGRITVALDARQGPKGGCKARVWDSGDKTDCGKPVVGPHGFCEGCRQAVREAMSKKATELETKLRETHGVLASVDGGGSE